MSLNHHLSTDESHGPQEISVGQGMEGQWIFCHEGISTWVKQPVMMTYRWSISSMISFAVPSLCVKIRYSLTQVTIWSLNVPLITWCGRSSDKSSWMSAQGKYGVKGWFIRQSQQQVALDKCNAHFDISSNTKLLPQNTGIKTFDQHFCFLVWSSTWSWHVEVGWFCLTPSMYV